jgi:hypothetical protein
MVNTPAGALKDIQTAQRENEEQIPLLVTRNGATRYLGRLLATG